MSNRSKLFFQFFFLILFSVHVSAQTSSSSPYSRYGIGDLQFGGLTKNLGMGGISAGYNHPYNLNISNPASYSALTLTTFETAVNFNQFQLKTSAKTQNLYNASLSYFAFGFPVKAKKWGTAFGLLPYSNVGYTINDRQTNLIGDPELHTYEGSGGLNQFFIGNGFSPFKNFSIGLNASWLFGVIKQQRRIEYPYLAGYFNTRISEATSIGGFNFNIGIQWTFDSLRTAPSDSIKLFDKKLAGIKDSIELVKANRNKSEGLVNTSDLTIRNLNELYERTDSLKKLVEHRKDKSDWSITLGFVASPKNSLNATNSLLTESFVYNSFNEIVIRDTIENISSENGKLVMPLSAGFGITLKQGNRWLIGSDFSMQSWKDYSLFGTDNLLANSWRVALGAQFTPNDRAIKSFLKTVQYRMGFHYEQTYLELHDTQLAEYGLSIGLGIPVKRSAAMLHLSAEAGRRGTVSNSLIEENFVKLSIGFTLNDRWFIRTKID